ncbi:RNA-dependent RNA polymerase 6-like [Macadamia integrifolia]|uniref:RNA-dependent RNA polymerase 6-like n=1 Tax=Macadamia integrifolia TaxID=60698 RepID=UPI001C4F5466|nr:RNA-dependent RNA polymerase 6-like [Macadamia integrifolia]XP_042505200.1 RNA-dependent RNA polymerase 6-like [Macadamia integrifolia]
MGSEGTQKDMVVTQVSFGGFDRSISAKELAEFLEHKIGLIWRCRLKASWTPPESFPNFGITNMEGIQITLDYQKVEPHAFVHFASPDSATAAFSAAGRCDLMLKMKPLRVNLGPESPFHMNQRRRTTNPFKFSDVRVEIGTLVSRDEFFVGWKGPTYGVDFLVDPFDEACKIRFTKETAFSFKGTTTHAAIKCDFKVEFMVREIAHIKQYSDTSSLIILLQLISSPCVYYRTADDDIHESVPFDMLDDEDPWIRTTDFTHSGVIGRCNSYRISISPRFGPKLKKAVDYLKERRIPYEHPRQSLQILVEPDFGEKMSDTFFCIHHKEGISFEIMFLVNAIMHKGIMNQHQLSNKFFDLLRMHTREVNVTALKHICTYKHPVFDAYKRLKLVQAWLLKDPKLLNSSKGSDDNAEVRRLVITPTKAYCLPPEVELSNRVLRKYKNVVDRFLRVTFMDEGFQPLNSNVLSYYVAPIVRDITSNSFPQKTTIFKRVRAILIDGFYLCGRKYSFLAFSSNQLRDRSAWFFAEDESISVVDIRSWMGKFTNRNVAKCAARMGQCFSSTYATVEVPIKHVNPELPDIERNGFVFSDGIGMLTPDLAVEVAEKLQLTIYPPCAYQIRYAGCKGVIACWPEKEDGIRLSLRPSMNKFESKHTILEVVSWTRFQPGYLNRQIVTLLSALDVPDDVFSRMQDSMVYKLNQMHENTDVAFDVLTSSCGEQGNTAAMMLSAGFKPQTEPHLKGMLSCIRAAQLRDLLAKARIFVPSGRWLMGCLDEIGVLEQGQCFIQISSPSLENCFLKHGSRFSETKRNLEVIKGIVAIAKNPCLHPGDVRILEAVDVPGLHHLSDCLVFPQKGDRPHTNEASGSDLDGDLYFVTWDENLIPPSKTSWLPMDYSPVEAKKLPRAVSHLDIIDFFLRNMVTENLGVICNAHVVHADRSEYGALDEKCIQLAELAATAVDFPKTGKLVTMPQALKPKMYPDFMGKSESQSYKSKKILGKLYRKIKDASEEVPASLELTYATEDISYDADLEIPGSADFLEDAWNHKLIYDGQLSALLGQYKVNREEEVVTGHIWSMPKHNSKKQGELKERLKHAYNALKKEFKQIFENMGPDSQKLTDDEKNTAYEQKASAWYQVTYHPRWVKEARQLREPEAEKLSSMLSFAWIPADYLVCIKIRRRGMKNVDAIKPIDTLAKYLVERM